jgi:hypothetical protein
MHQPTANTEVLKDAPTTRHTHWLAVRSVAAIQNCVLCLGHFGRVRVVCARKGVVKENESSIRVCVCVRVCVRGSNVYRGCRLRALSQLYPHAQSDTIWVVFNFAAEGSAAESGHSHIYPHRNYLMRENHVII